ncbi:IPExxxVDY family protein [Tenacibaculum sp. Bg11-29]|uniref:IPExxxVDY family protein n=1 Tax=Tenacibaculum sp. Bg11-29 TaxID=2058306 RepID=UPI000C348424|nr:IPExxxVDY family protein [Tenacibaculum sp. Bg11-29]PKH50177.1 IPExxxVDY family protein [Tenacibaculum sp. Bg11-29]
MVTYALNINEFSTNDFALIAIHTVLSEYQLAYLLNKHLQIKFSKASYNLDFTEKKNQASYTVYEYTNTELDYDWFLIANVCKSTLKTASTNLFIESDSISRLIPEKKKVDFFLKIEGGFDFDYIVKTIEIINRVPQIITSYEVEVESLKSKDFLIF